MSNRKKVFSLANELGSTIETNTDNGFQIRVEAPKGYHWQDEIHEISRFQFSGFKTELLWLEVLEVMKEGIEPCNDNCEWWD